MRKIIHPVRGSEDDLGNVTNEGECERCRVTRNIWEDYCPWVCARQYQAEEQGGGD